MTDNDQWNKWVKGFLKNWFDGLMKGMENLEGETRGIALEHAGRNCARVSALETFKSAWDNTDNIDDALEFLNKEFKTGTYKKIANNAVQVTYAKCYCPLVRLELVNSPHLCDCSVAWHRENFEEVLNKPVKVTVDEAVLRGGEKCRLTVSF